MILCDADILVDVDRLHPPAVAWFSGVQQDVTLAGVARLELVDSRSNKQELRKIQRLISPLATVWPNAAAGNYAVDLMVRFNLSHGLQKYDALVAVVALSLQVPLHTHNVKHYHFIPGLRAIQPYPKARGNPKP